MTSKKIIVTVSALCANLGIEYKQAARYYMVGNGLVCSYDGGSFLNKPAHSWVTILSVGDKIEMDECARCGENHQKHDQNEFCSGQIGKYEEEYDTWKPLLATVRAIRLVERCECKGTDNFNHLKAFHEDGINGVCAQLGCNCKQFKPVQMEITYTED